MIGYLLDNAFSLGSDQASVILVWIQIYYNTAVSYLRFVFYTILSFMT